MKGIFSEPEMRISVVIPAFDRLDSLRSVLRSWAQPDNEIELILVDDKSPNADALRKTAADCNAVYVRNESARSEREPALCRNLGFEASLGDIIVFNDADIIAAPNAAELFVRYHTTVENAVVDAQVWSISGGQVAVDSLNSFALDELTSVSKPFYQAEIDWSTASRPRSSNNWWAFLSAQCSFKRETLMAVGGWDREYSGWGVEDNDMGYRICAKGFGILYARDIPCFHIDHAVSREEYMEKCRSALRNLKRMSEKYPEVMKDDRVRSRIKELEGLVKTNLAKISRQSTAGGGPIT